MKIVGFFSQLKQPSKIKHFNPGRPRFGSVRSRFGDETVRAVPVFGSGGSSAKGVFLCFSAV